MLDVKVHRSEKQTRHFGHCHLLPALFHDPHDPSPLIETCVTTYVIQAHTSSIPIQTILQNDCEARKTWQNTSKSGWWVGQRRTSGRGTSPGHNRAEIFSERWLVLRNGRITCLPNLRVAQVRKLGGKTKRLAVDGKTFLETAFAATCLEHLPPEARLGQE